VLAKGIAFCLAVVNNFILNRLWTYPDSRSKSLLAQVVQFGLVSLVGLGINLVVFRWVDNLALQRLGNVLALYTAQCAAVGVALAERLRRQGHGSLVALSTVAAERPRRSNFVYGSTKAGLDSFYTGLTEALRPSGVRVSVVRPGFVHTRMTEGMKAAPLSQTAEQVADVVVATIRSGREQAWAPSQLRWVMSVLRHLPRAVFRRLPV